MINRFSVIIFSGLLFAAASSAGDTLPKEQIYSLFTQANAVVGDPAKADSLYEKAVLGYEKIISEGRIRNPKLYYNLANAYLLRDDLGRAILNYRRAESLDKSDSNIRKNLAFVRGKKIDKVEPKTETQILRTLVFWHYDLSMRAKLAVAVVCFAVFCLGLAAALWFARRASLTIITIIAAVLLVCSVGSLLVDNYNRSNDLAGVVVSPEVIAYQGDGQNYPQSFKGPLHAGAEFELIERRPSWFHIKLADGSDGWIPQSSAELI
jgi:tetratricopeptide (TPR) repeat protein